MNQLNYDQVKNDIEKAKNEGAEFIIVCPHWGIEYVLEGSTADQNGFSENDNLELRDVSFYQDSSVFVATVMVQRRKKGFLDIAMQLVSSYDSPNYF